MRLTALLLLGLLTLSGCSAPDTPLAHALLALQSGDRDAFLRAQAEAHDALKTAWKDGGDICDVTVKDFQKYGEASLIDKMDHADLFRLDEAQRFVYAAHIAGRIDASINDAVNAERVEAWMHPSSRQIIKGCPHGGGFDALKLEETGIPGDDERIAVFRDWRQELRDDAGSEDAYQARMRRAAADLDANGFAAEWPAKLELNDDDGQVPSSFESVRNKIGG